MALLSTAEQARRMYFECHHHNATDADALATSVSVMGPEKGIALIETLPNTEAILLTSEPNSKILKTQGTDKYTK